MSSDLLGGPLYIVTLFCLLVSAPVAIGIAWLVLRRYQAVLLLVMSQASVHAVAAPAPVQHSPPLAPRSVLQIEFIALMRGEEHPKYSYNNKRFTPNGKSVISMIYF